MPFISQNKFPRCWSLFQFWMGGTVDKRKLCRLHYKGERRILEVGCASGNTSRTFMNQHGIQFTGLDIDPVALELARKQFASYPNFVFKCQDVPTLLAEKNGQFDYILFSGVCHHIDDQSLLAQLSAAAQLLDSNGSLVVVDPLIPYPQDAWFIHLFFRLEQGHYLRSARDLATLIEHAQNLTVCDGDEYLISATPFGFPVCARFGVYRARRE